MFSYYGSKSKIVDYYPYPKYDKIIEPFAGSARYALKHFQKDVLLIDKYDKVIDVWKWLQSCSPKDILNLPKLTKGLDIRELQLSEIEKTFLGFLVVSGRWGYVVSKFMDYYNGNQKVYERIANQLYKIKHWEIRLGDYREIENEIATWFIDPPYQYGGEHYKESNKKINFVELADWCKSRKGQSIVCENTKANWMDFKPVIRIQGASQTNTTEAIWSNLETEYDYETINMFEGLDNG